MRTPFAGNVIPASRFDPIAVKYMQLYPMPTGPGLANNFSYTNERTQDNDATDVRVDHRFNDRNTIFARYSYNKTDTLTPSLCPPTVIGRQHRRPDVHRRRRGNRQLRRTELHHGAQRDGQLRPHPERHDDHGGEGQLLEARHPVAGAEQQ